MADGQTDRETGNKADDSLGAYLEQSGSLLLVEHADEAVKHGLRQIDIASDLQQVGDGSYTA